MPSFETMFLIVSMLLFLAVLIILLRRTHSTNQKFETSANILQALLTALAIMIAAQWYFVERAHKPHATVEQTVNALKVADDQVLIHLNVGIENPGKRVLEFDDYVVRLLHVAPFELPLDRFRTWQAGEWPPALYDNGEIGWLTLREFQGHRRHTIEPGETDHIFADLLVSCNHDILKITAEIAKPDWSDQWWKAKSYLDLRNLCRSGAAPTQEGK